MIVESAKTRLTRSRTSQRFAEAFDALELVVVIDVAMTETARHADYVLPAASQYEKAEATYFNFEFPANTFQLRHPPDGPAPPGRSPRPRSGRAWCGPTGLIDGARPRAAPSRRE